MAFGKYVGKIEKKKHPNTTLVQKLQFKSQILLMQWKQFIQIIVPEGDTNLTSFIFLFVCLSFKVPLQSSIDVILKCSKWFLIMMMQFLVKYE